MADGVGADRLAMMEALPSSPSTRWCPTTGQAKVSLPVARVIIDLGEHD